MIDRAEFPVHRNRTLYRPAIVAILHLAAQGTGVILRASGEDARSKIPAPEGKNLELQAFRNLMF